MSENSIKKVIKIKYKKFFKNKIKITFKNKIQKNYILKFGNIGFFPIKSFRFTERHINSILKSFSIYHSSLLKCRICRACEKYRCAS